ncbi:MAG: histidine kinase N-terminal domain-containing protein [Mycoplasmatales bacterium]
MFIDVKDPQNPDQAYVLAEVLNAKNSVYSNSVLGQIATRENEPAVLKCLDTGLICQDFKGLSQENKAIRQSVLPIQFNQKTIACIVEERLYIENNQRTDLSNPMELNDIQALVVKIIGFSPGLLKEACLIFNQNNELVHYNLKAAELYKKLGFSDELKKYKFDQLILSKHDFKNREISQKMVKISKMYLSERLISFEREIISKIVLIEDVTKVKQIDEELLNAKQVIREIHHRIKNNLQIISSMLRIQAVQAKSLETKNVLNESMQRIHAIAAVHDLLSISIFDKIKLKEIVQKLIENYQLLGVEYQINFQSNIGEIELDSHKATTVTIIINELISNSIEHGFSDHRKKNEEYYPAEISIKAQIKEQLVTLIVADNGVGTSINHQSSGLGTKIIQSYVQENLHGIIEVDTTSGRITTIKFYN